MGKKDDGFLGGLIAAAALGGLGRYGKPRKLCFLCQRGIGPGEGYRDIPGRGTAHGACLKEQEGKDARQGQADGSGDRGGVCPES